MRDGQQWGGRVLKLSFTTTPEPALLTERRFVPKPFTPISRQRYMPTETM